MANRGDMVSVPETIIQDIATLKASQSDMRRSVDEGNRNTQNAIATLSGRMDSITDLLQTVTRIAERQEAHGSGLDRAFTSIKQVDTRIDDAITESQQWRTAHTESNASVERKLSTWHGVAIGISFTSALVVGMLAWAGNEIVESVRNDTRELREINRRDDERLDAIERQQAQYHGDPAK